MGAILWVTDGATISTNETPLYNHLSDHSITLHNSSSSVPASYQTIYDMVLISGDLASGGTNPGSRYKTSTIPVLVLNGYTAVAMELGGARVSKTLGTNPPYEYHMWNITSPAEHPVAAALDWTDNSYINIVYPSAEPNSAVAGLTKGGVVGEQILCRTATAQQQFLIDYTAGDTLDDGTTLAGDRFFWGVESLMYRLDGFFARPTISTIIEDYWGIAQGQTPSVTVRLSGGGGLGAEASPTTVGPAKEVRAFPSLAEGLLGPAMSGGGSIIANIPPVVEGTTSASLSTGGGITASTQARIVGETSASLSSGGGLTVTAGRRGTVLAGLSSGGSVDASSSNADSRYTFTPPVRTAGGPGFELPKVSSGRIPHDLWKYYADRLTIGYSVFITDSVATPYPGRVVPSADQIRAADSGSGEGGKAWFRGGNTYRVTAAEKTILDAAGYEDHIT